MKKRSICLALACVLFGGCGTEPVDPEIPDENTLVMFYSVGPLCIYALDWLDDMEARYPDLAIQKRLIHDEGQTEVLFQMEAQYGQSQGLSTSFGLLPITFFGGQAFSGFNDEVRQTLEALVASADGSG